MSAFGDAIESLRVSGQILLVESYNPPWGIEIPNGDVLRAALKAPKDIKIVPFHMVRRGSFELQPETGDPIIIRDGEVVICMGSQAHLMIQGEPRNIIPFLDILADDSDENPVQYAGGSTELVCGIFMMRNTPHNPLIDALPPTLHTDVSGRGGGKTLELVADLLVDELQSERVGGPYMSARLVELFCAESIRGHMDRFDPDHPGWFKALKDPNMAAAIDAFHAAPENDWSVAALASMAGMSGSRFAVKFKSLLGITPMHYVGGWRMNVAARLLVDTNLSLAGIALQVGYESVAAFSRTFKKYLNVPPAQWRKDAS